MAKEKTARGFHGEQSASPKAVNASQPEAIKKATADVVAAPAPATAPTDAQASVKRRREELFLGDTELFAFDFGGAATSAVPSPQDEDANQTEAEKQVKSKELAAVTARLAVVSDAQGARRVPMTLEQVSQCAAAARESPLTSFFFFPGPRPTKRATRESEEGLTVGTAARRGTEEAATLADAHTYFENGLRKYDEALWRAHKTAKAEEKAKRKRQQPSAAH